MAKITLSINGTRIVCDAGKSLLHVCADNGIGVPTLCFHPQLRPTEACGICVVEAEGREQLIKSCANPAEEGMRIHTESPRVVAARAEALGKILESHPADCLGCTRSRVLVPPSPLPWHLSRATHVAEMCVGCGACQDACPAGIPLLALHLTLADKLHASSGYLAGTGAISPLRTASAASGPTGTAPGEWKNFCGVCSCDTTARKEKT